MEVERGWPISLITSQPSVSRLSRKYGNLNVSQCCGPQRSDMISETSFFFIALGKDLMTLSSSELNWIKLG
jgi:hypothetical protein